MIIGLDASRANLNHKTGTEWYSFHLIKNLAVIDRVNTYWLYIDKPPLPELVAAVKDNPNFQFKLLNWPLYSFWTLGRLTLEMVWRRPDVLFVPAHVLPLVSPKKTVNTIHDIAFVREKNLYRSTKVKTEMRGFRSLINFMVRAVTLGKYRSESVDYLYWSTNFALKQAKKIISVSEFTKQEILDHYQETPADKIMVVSNGYDNQIYRPDLEIEKVKTVLASYDLVQPYFLYVGRLEKKKNISQLIDSFAMMRENHPELQEARLVLVGNAGYGFDEIKYQIEQFNLNSRVIMPGWISETDMPYVYNGARAFVFPSRHEGFGIPVLQSMGCGLPAAVSDLDVLREVAGESALYFNPLDRASLAVAMARVFQDEELRDRLKKNGLERARQFSWEKCARETLKVLENL